jgi:hypothetical protein
LVSAKAFAAPADPGSRYKATCASYQCGEKSYGILGGLSRAGKIIEEIGNSYHHWRMEGQRLVAETEESHLVRYFLAREPELFLECSEFTPIGQGFLSQIHGGFKELVLLRVTSVTLAY